MKKLIQLLITCSALQSAYAQTPTTTYAQMDINNINARSMVLGDGWWDPIASVAHCEYPKGSGKNVGFAYGIWMGGYDAGNQLHIAAQTYRQTGNDYWPGPIDSNNLQPTLYLRGNQWAKIWQVNKMQLDSFFSQPIHTLTNTPTAILDWPAKGNTYALDAQGNPLTINRDLAPFVDLNHNGIYEPLQGEFPKIKGDKMLWWIINDAGVTHTATSGAAQLGVEIVNQVYAYHRNNAMDNVIFYEYNITNKSPNNYHNFRMGTYTDFDLGFYADDLIGFDSVRRMGYQFNGTGSDAIYGTQIPSVAMLLVAAPADSNCQYKQPTGAFNIPIFGFDSSMRSTRFNGHFYTTPPSYNECSINYPPGDRTFEISSGDANLNAGQTLNYTYALLVAPNAGGCPTYNLNGLSDLSDSVASVYCNPPPPLAVINNLLLQSGITIFPNPTHATFQLSNKEPINIQIFNTLGQIILAQKVMPQENVSIAEMPKGLYLVRDASTNIILGKVMKE